MITLTRITNPDSTAYRKAEELLTATFPRDEYRDLAEQRANVAGKENFHFMQAYCNGEFIGLASYWLLDAFCYIEHLATLPAQRGKGHGKRILEQLQEEHHRIVLEVEEPIDEITTRRIDFYRRAGFTLCNIPYTQPPYRKGGNSLPMLLMFHGWEADRINYERAKESIYRNIYNLKE
ncbi:MAG: GNAT family N-acetyltransferase [Bacteroidaceae bacterium]|nr:GNAT family N-acetyltransferase [Bacteroidaceae bacterium]